MKVVPKYYDKKTAPMKYYKLLTFLLVVWIIVSVVRTISFLAQSNAIGAIECCILIFLSAVSLAYLNKMEWKGVQFLYAIYIFDIIDQIIALLIYASADMLTAYTGGQVIGSIIGILVWAIPTYFYFEHRRPLFDPYYQNEIVPDTKSSETTPLQSVEPSPIVKCNESLQNDHKIKYCRKCGFKLLDDSQFCSNCGTRIIRENEK